MSWTRALITGASSGIGEAMARQLAGEGTALVLVARDAARLHALAGELDVDVEVLPADLADGAQRAAVEDRLRDGGRPIDLLVNNAGIGHGGPFVESDVDAQHAQIELNVTALVRLTHAAAAGMVERGTGTILNVSSLGALQPTPGWATYGASKAFVTFFTEAIHEELRFAGVVTTAVLPGFTRTAFQAKAGAEGREAPDFLWQSAEEVAAEALAGAAAGRAVVITGAKNRVVAAVSAPLPRGMKRRLAGRISRRTT